ncbi:MAG TPA: phosphatidylglycerol lysyltransferase domain-containing protein [Methanotrichaceae archaeon]|nr:phosphatidylglycerol lysyltransferase domain-containing protein [Methanotrichaceae archaeon]
MLSNSDFRPVSLDDKDFFFEHYKRFPQAHSDNTFTNMVCWNHYAHYRFAFKEDNILLSSTIDGLTRYRPPIGPRNPDLLAEVMSLAARSSEDFPLVILDAESKEWISGLYPELNLYPERKYFDYVYRASDLAMLPGKKYSTIRHQLNQFQRNCEHTVEPITEDNATEVRGFLEEWCVWKDCDSEPVLANEKDALFFAISHFSKLSLSGLVIRVKGSIMAMALFEGQNINTAVVHFEKALLDCKGIYRAINAETAKFLVKDYIYINRESDMGIEGLREAKTRYHPDHMVEVHLAKREEIEKII